MENVPESQKNTSAIHKNKIHRILAHSYAVYFIFFLLGIILDVIFPYQLIFNKFLVYIGIAFFIFATFLIFWAQRTSHTFKKDNLSKETFCRGPYCYTRSPTHWGLFILLLSFGVITNAFFVIVFTFLAFIITRFTFLKKEEQALAEKYGTPYLEYHRSIKL